MYKEAYQLMKRADSSWWDNVKSSVKQGWKDFNDYADKNDWVRPVTYGTVGTGAMTGLGALMGGKRGAIIGASIAAPTTTAAGFVHNHMRRADRDAANQNTANKEKKQEQKQSQPAQQKAVSPSEAKEQEAYNTFANKQPEKPKSLAQKAKEKMIAGKEAVGKKIEERKQRKAQQRAAREAAGQPQKQNIVQRTVNKGKEKMADIKASREAKKQEQAQNPQAAKPSVVQRIANKTKETAGKVKATVNEKRQQRQAAKEQAAFQTLSTPQGAIPVAPTAPVQQKKKPSMLQAAAQKARQAANKVKTTVQKKPQVTPPVVPPTVPATSAQPKTTKDKAKDLVEKYVPMSIPVSAPASTSEPAAPAEEEVTPDRIAQAKAMLYDFMQKQKAGGAGNAATVTPASIRAPGNAGDLIADTIAGIPGLTPSQQARLQFVLPRYRNKAIDMINARYPNASDQQKMQLLIEALQNQARQQLGTGRMY